MQVLREERFMVVENFDLITLVKIEIKLYAIIWLGDGDFPRKMKARQPMNVTPLIMMP